jgi:hypothetical protein
VREWRVFFARREADFVELHAIAIPGALLYDLAFTMTQPAGASKVRPGIGGEMIDPQPRVGDRIRVERVPNIDARVEKL